MLSAAQRVPPLSPGAVGLIAAVARDRAIGRGGTIPWHVPEDRAFFAELTTPGVQICGRIVWGEGQAHRLDADPARQWVVVSRSQGFSGPRVRTVRTVADALATARRLAAAQAWPIWGLGGPSFMRKCCLGPRDSI